MRWQLCEGNRLTTAEGMLYQFAFSGGQGQAAVPTVQAPGGGQGQAAVPTVRKLVLILSLPGIYADRLSSCSITSNCAFASEACPLP